MTHSFSFGFGSDDIEENVDEMVESRPSHDTRKDKPVAVMEPKLHKLQDLLSALPSKISYRTVQIRSPAGILNLPRRELFDIRAQLMAEDNVSDQLSPAVGLSTDDITPNVYEGGFKTWECAMDLASHLSESLSSNGWELGGREAHVVEVGAGTALPMLVFFDFFLRQWSPEWRAVHLSVADYNLSVLENATLPNLLLTWYFVRSTAVSKPSGDLEITPGLLSQFIRDLLDKAIYIRGISGAWSETFSDLLVPFQEQSRSRVETVVLASETIYSQGSIHAFTRILLEALKSAEETDGHGRALVAAKKIYFGVGGGVDEFLKVLSELGGKGATAWESEDKGVGRVIVEVQRAGGNAAK